jgi:NADPH:quinone reductase-like Zn-dependent oxidoreductase
MKAAWYEKQGPALEVLVVGEIPDPNSGVGEVRIRIAASGINPGDVKKRQDSFGYGVLRASFRTDAAGQLDQVREGVPSEWIGHRMWCYGAQSYRPFGTAGGSARSCRSIAKERLARGRRLPGDTGHHGASRRTCWWRRSGAYDFSTRGRRRRRNECSPACAAPERA